MVDIAVIFGADRSRALKELKESVELEMKLANVIKKAELNLFGGVKCYFCLVDFYTKRRTQKRDIALQSDDNSATSTNLSNNSLVEIV